MNLQAAEPEKFLEHRGVAIYHAYKDEFSDVPLYYWYSTSSGCLPGSEYEFDVRELPEYRLSPLVDELSRHRLAILAAIDAGIIDSDRPVSVNI